MVIFQLKPDDWCIILIVLLNLNCQLEFSGKMTSLVSHQEKKRQMACFLHGQGALQGNLPLSWLNSREQHHLQETEKKEKVLVAQSCQLFVTPWTVTRQAPLSMGFSRQEYWSGLSFLSSGDLPDPGIEPRSPALQADSSPSEPPRKPSGNCADVQIWRLATDQPLPLRFPFFWGCHLLPSLLV